MEANEEEVDQLRDGGTKKDSIARRAKRVPVEGRRVVPNLVKAWKAALHVSEQDLAAFVPTPVECAIGEAFLEGCLSTQAISDQTHFTKYQIQAVLQNPVAMAWISRTIYIHFQHRAALIDAALYQRALTGDIAACKLFYERLRLMTGDRNLNVNISGSYNVSALSDADLRALIADKSRGLPQLKVIECSTAPH